MSYLGIPLARSEFTSVVEKDRFRIKGRMSSSGVARVFDQTEGTMVVRGRIKQGRAIPDSYRLDYRTDTKKKRTVVRFKDGRVTDTENVPPLRKRKDWIAVSAADLAAVTDPISATLVAADTPQAVCARTLKLYDGEMRADLKLQPSSVTDWYGRQAAVCTARFAPVSGYKTTKRAIEYLRTKSQIAITFAQLGRTGFYAPVDASVGTEIGTIRITADAPAAIN